MASIPHDVVSGASPAALAPQNEDCAAYFVAQQSRDAATTLALHLLQQPQNGTGPLVEWLFQQPRQVVLTPTSATLLLLASHCPDLSVHLALARVSGCPSCWEMLRRNYPQLTLPMFPGRQISSGFCAPHLVAMRGVA